MPMRLPLFGILLMILTACSGGGSGQLANDAALEDCTYLALDLRSGMIAAMPDSAGADLDRWRTSDDRMLFRRLDAQHCWIGVFEVTDAQWGLVTRQPSSLGRLPVTGIAPADVDAELLAFPMANWHLALPTSALWEAAADGEGKLFAWGDGTTDIQAATYAVCLRSDNSTPGLQPVGSLPSTGLGFCDLHGNAWELVADAGAYTLRGGAWDSPVMNCRIANAIPIAADLGHPLVGFRLVLRP